MRSHIVMLALSVTLFALSITLFACTSTQRNSQGDLVEGTGTVNYVELEGGFYGIVDDDGRQFDPMDLDESLKEDGLRVRFRARTIEDVASIHMWGTVVEIIAIERI